VLGINGSAKDDSKVVELSENLLQEKIDYLKQPLTKVEIQTAEAIIKDSYKLDKIPVKNLFPYLGIWAARLKLTSGPSKI